MLVGKRRRLLRYLERRRPRALPRPRRGARPAVDDLAGDHGSRLHPARPGRRERLARPISAAAGWCSSSTRPTSARSARTSSRSTRRCRRSRSRARRCSASASTAMGPQGLSGEARHRHDRCSPTSSRRARSPRPTAPTSTPGDSNRSLVLIDAEASSSGSTNPEPGGDPRRQPDLRRAGGDRLTPQGSGGADQRRGPAVGPDDHVRGEGEALIVYADLGCPHCAAAGREVAARPARVVFRHFPVASKHPRAPALHAAAEAAGLQGRFFEMVDSLYADRGRVDDPHLWERAERSASTSSASRPTAARRGRRTRAARLESGVRAGVTSTPALFPDAR